MRFKTLEDFLEYSCGMAPPPLVEYYEEHREWVENQLSLTYDFDDQQQYEDMLDDLWLCLPEPPDGFFVN